jgi:post-segregation antitoxin (ccd killing protein)
MLEIWSNRIGGVMVSGLVSSTIDREFEPRSDQTQDYKIGICCFSALRELQRSKSKDWLARNQNKMSEWSDIYTRGMLFANKNPAKCDGLIQSGHHLVEMQIVVAIM